MPRPEGDYKAQGVVPLRVYENLEAAQRFLVETFSFSPGVIERDAGGRTVHAEIFMGRTAVWLHRVDPEHGLASARGRPTQPGGLVVFVPDVDAHYRRARSKGAEIISPPQDQPYGQREYATKDLEGNYWYFATRTG